ncbi:MULTISPECIES: hypothetical protein [Streptococcus]|uniref:hypothetical protein n=1 Tax=Streptococcus TaxID=1301 RepID=UPI0013DB486A|nr:hypothetical protein [Streptococcus canis]QKG74735.1 hypothetical protein GE023_005135 [Streptococcus canis]
MPKFRKKPVEIEAVRFVGSNYEEIREFIGQNTLCSDLSIVIPTLEGDMVAQKGDYIIKGIKGEFYPCKPDIFEETYEEVISIPKNQKLSISEVPKRFI